jgi:hydroxymethylbilane synthase
MRIRVATRGSHLAWTQSGLVADALRAQGHEVELVRITTHGDVSSAPLAALGGVGVFVGAVREAVLAGTADIAVHSFKDLPTAPAAGLVLAAVPQREEPADALCSRGGRRLADLPSGATVGTGSPRRAAQLLALRPDLAVVAIRGNVETRLARTSEDLDAVVLAAAGLRRLGLADRISELFDLTTFLPAPAQGALAVECREDAPADLVAALAAVDDPQSRVAALAERAVLEGLEAGCAAPVAAYARLEGGRLVVTARVVATDGSAQLEESASAALDAEAAVTLGHELADALLARGAAALVDLTPRSRPLAGRRVIVPARSPEGLPELLVEAGADVVTASFTRIEPLAPTDLDAAWQDPFDWLVVTSPTTARLLRGRTLPNGVRVAAVGPATASSLVTAGFPVDHVAGGSGASLSAELGPGPGRALLPGPRQRSAEPTAGLEAAGWEIVVVDLYETLPEPPSQALTEAWPSADALVVTAGSVARAAIAGCSLPGPVAVALGESSAAACREVGLRVGAVAARPDAASVRDAVVRALSPTTAIQDPWNVD